MFNLNSRGLSKFYYKSKNSQNGFTLIEIAIVLVILGLLIGLGAALLGPLIKQSKYKETKSVVRQAREAVLGYVVKNGYLPSTLEDAGARALDAWGNSLIYYPATEFDTSGEDACKTLSTTLGGSSFEVYECTTDNCSSYNTKSNIGFIVFSKGPDANGGGTDPGNDGTPPFYIRVQDTSYTDGGAGYNYDDLVEYASLDEIRERRGCPQPLDITSPAILPEGEEDSFYSYQLTAFGGKPPYSWSTAGPTSGLSISSSGLISGTININTSSSTGELTACSDSITFTGVTVTDSLGSTATANITVPVRPRPVRIITETIPSAYEGSTYSATISATGGNSSSYSWSSDCSSISGTGLTCSSDTISGTPSTGSAGTYTVTFSIDDSCTTDTRTYGLTINPSSGGGGGTTYSLTVSKTGTGTGTVTSSDGLINCGTDCSETYSSSTSVTLYASADTGSTFAGWGGDCSSCGTSKSCSVTVDSAKSCSTQFDTSGGGGGGSDPCGGSHGDLVCDSSNPPIIGSNGTSGQTYPSGDFHSDEKNIYISMLCEASNGCSGHTFTSFSLECTSNCTGLPKFKKISYSIENPIGSGVWTTSDNTVYNKKQNLPILNQAFDKGKKIPVNSGERVAIEMRFDKPLSSGTYGFTLTLYESGTPYTYEVTISVP